MSADEEELLEETVRIKHKKCMPPVPEPTLLLETLRMEDDRTHCVEISSNVFADYSLVQQEFSLHPDSASDAFARYRDALLSQMLKRRWFTAITDHNTRTLFLQRPPDTFVSFIGDVIHRVNAAIDEAAAGVGEGAAVLASARRSGAVKLILKGGNMVNLLKYSAVRVLTNRARPKRSRTDSGSALDPRIAKLCNALQPSGLSGTNRACFLCLSRPHSREVRIPIRICPIPC